MLVAPVVGRGKVDGGIQHGNHCRRVPVEAPRVSHLKGRGGEDTIPGEASDRDGARGEGVDGWMLVAALTVT